MAAATGHGTRSRGTAFLISIIFLCSTRPVVRAEQFIELRAEIASASRRLDPKKRSADPIILSRKVFFVNCTIGTNKWRIESDFLGDAKETAIHNGIDTILFRTRGRTETVFESFEPGDRTARRRSGIAPTDLPASNTVITSALASDHPHPLGNLGVNVPWLAFCSGAYLRDWKDPLPLPISDSRHRLDSFGYSHQAELFDDPLGLPKALRFHVSRQRLKNSPSDSRFLRDPRKTQWRSNPPIPAFPDGTLKCLYEVSESTNFAGWNIPLRFRIVQYSEQVGKWEPAYELIGKVLYIKHSIEPPFGLDRTREYQIIDYRFRSNEKMVDLIMYRTNIWGQLPSVTDPRLVKIFEAAVAAAPRDPLHGKATYIKIVIWIALASILLTPFALYVFSKRQQEVGGLH